jgi:hypothetical protein
LVGLARGRICDPDCACKVERKAVAFDFVGHPVERSANSEFIAALEAAGNVKFVAAGDCVAPRNIFHAVREGFDAADRLAAALSQA